MLKIRVEIMFQQIYLRQPKKKKNNKENLKTAEATGCLLENN